MILRACVAAVALTLIVSTLPAAHASAGGERSQAAKTPRIVNVPVTIINTPGRSGFNGIVDVRLGNTAPIRVILDTGSVGLRLWSAPKSVAEKATTRIETPINGALIPARLGNTRMTLSSTTTTTAVPFALTSVQGPYIDEWMQAGVSGILGIGIGAAVGSGQLTNPLRSLPGALGRQWSVHFADTGSLILGARPPIVARMHFALTTDGTNAQGAPLWNDKAAPACWRFGAAVERCVRTTFDSGFPAMRIRGRAFDRLPVTDTDQLKPGTRVELAVASSAFIGDTFIAGDNGSQNLARVLPSGRASVNTGNTYFFRYKVTYNALTGDIYLSEPPTQRNNDG